MERSEERSQKSNGKTQKSNPNVPLLLPFALCAFPLDFSLCLLLTALCLVLPSCRIGPEYKRPPAAAPLHIKSFRPRTPPGIGVGARAAQRCHGPRQMVGDL